MALRRGSMVGEGKKRDHHGDTEARSTRGAISRGTIQKRTVTRASRPCWMGTKEMTSRLSILLLQSSARARRPCPAHPPARVLVRYCPFSEFSCGSQPQGLRCARVVHILFQKAPTCGGGISSRLAS